jgi:hypothetical protein
MENESEAKNKGSAKLGSLISTSVFLTDFEMCLLQLVTRRGTYLDSPRIDGGEASCTVENQSAGESKSGQSEGSDGDREWESSQTASKLQAQGRTKGRSKS